MRAKRNDFFVQLSQLLMPLGDGNASESPPTRGAANPQRSAGYHCMYRAAQFPIELIP